MAISKGKKPGPKKAGIKAAPKRGAGARAASKKSATRKPAPKTAVARKATSRATTGAALTSDARLASARPKAANPLSAREKLVAVRPSGSREDSFFDLVHEVARQIPKGRVTSYGAIGAALGTRGSARMVGWAMMAVPYAEKAVPAHRVVNRVGLLTGRHHYNPPEKMQQLLEKEGVQVVDNKVVDFKKLFWDPSQEL
jgi:methylated-DNA-protein-cysteine methyltransferase-like protein